MKNRYSLLVLFIALFLTYMLFAFKRPDVFLSAGNIEQLVRQSLVIGIGAIGMTMIIVSGGIDLSAGSVVALSTVCGAIALNSSGSVAVAIAVCLLSGTVCGIANGLLIAAFRAGPFIVTLVSMLTLRGFAKGIAHEKPVYLKDPQWIGSFTGALDPSRKWMVIAPGGWIWVACILIFALGMRYTVFGRNAVAIGSNEAAARLCGVRIQATKVGVYAVGGLMFGLAGLMLFSRTRTGDIGAAMGAELSMIAAAVIGGASLNGGQGNVYGTAIGALIMSTINMGCTSIGLANWIQEILTGVIILLAVGVDRWRAARHQAI